MFELVRSPSLNGTLNSAPIEAFVQADEQSGNFFTTLGLITSTLRDAVQKSVEIDVFLAVIVPRPSSCAIASNVAGVVVVVGTRVARDAGSSVRS